MNDLAENVLDVGLMIGELYKLIISMAADLRSVERSDIMSTFT